MVTGQQAELHVQIKVHAPLRVELLSSYSRYLSCVTCIVTVNFPNMADLAVQDARLVGVRRILNQGLNGIITYFAASWVTFGYWLNGERQTSDVIRLIIWSIALRP